MRNILIGIILLLLFWIKPAIIFILLFAGVITILFNLENGDED